MGNKQRHKQTKTPFVEPFTHTGCGRLYTPDQSVTMTNDAYEKTPTNPLKCSLVAA